MFTELCVRLLQINGSLIIKFTVKNRFQKDKNNRFQTITFILKIRCLLTRLKTEYFMILCN